MEKEQQSKTQSQKERICPNCGKDFSGKVKGRFAYGSPFRICDECKEPYYDDRYREICTDGILAKDRRIIPLWKIVAALLAFFLLLFSLSGWCPWIFGLDGMWILLIISFLSFVLLLGMILSDAVAYPGKKKRLKKLELESVTRISDPDYRKRLESEGKMVSEKYFSVLREQETETLEAE